MNQPHPNRRVVLRGLGGIALALPFLESLAPRHAQATGAPRRFVVFFTYNGFERDDLLPGTTGGLTPNTLTGKTIERVASYAGKMLIVRGLHGMPDRAVDAHAQAASRALTGAAYTDRGALGVSIDQVLAKQINPAGTPPLVLRAGRLQPTPQQVISYTGPGEGVPGESNPWNAYKKLVGLAAGGGDSRATIARLLRRRQSALDLCKARIDELRGGPLSAQDQATLDTYFSQLRDLEKAMTPGMGDPAVVAACSLPDATVAELQGIDGNKAMSSDVKTTGALIPDVTRLQIQVLALALACDRTRVATLAIGGSGSSFSTYSFLGQTMDEHAISHHGADQALYAEGLKLDRWRADQYRTLLDAVAAYKEPGGTVLDNSAIIWTSDLATGDHQSTDIPYIITGGLGGKLKQGIQVKATNGTKAATHPQLWVSMLKAFGVDNAAFGVDEARTSTPLDLLAG